MVERNIELKKKKILYVLPSLEAGGAEKAAVITANELTLRYGDEVSFFLFRGGNDLQNLLHPAVTVFDYPVYFDRSRFSRIYSAYWRVPMALMKHVRKYPADVIVSGFELGPEIPVLIFGLWNIMMLQKDRYRLVSILQNSLSAVLHHHPRNPLASAVSAFLRGRIFDMIVAVSQQIKNEIAHRTNDVVVIHNPVDVESVIRDSMNNVQMLPIKDRTKRYFISVARITRQKDQLMMLRAFNSIKDTIAENVLLVGNISESDYWTEIQQFIIDNDLSERVEYLGVIRNHHSLVAKATAFLFSSVYEGLPLALLECMALRTPIISTKFKGYEEILSQKNSLLVEDENEFAQRMLQVSSDRTICAKRTEQAKEDLVKFDIRVIAGQYHAIFHGESGGMR
ncbi:MAG: glycosyltransferase [Bacteroidota bacterium]